MINTGDENYEKKSRKMCFYSICHHMYSIWINNTKYFKYMYCYTGRILKPWKAGKGYTTKEREYIVSQKVKDFE